MEAFEFIAMIASVFVAGGFCGWWIGKGYVYDGPSAPPPPRDIKVRNLNVGPNDTPVLFTDSHLSEEQVARLRQEWERAFGNGTRLVVLGPGMDIDVLRKTN